ncbi:MAG: RecX family transcriptional regulator [Chloroflexi bacterium]|nr:RecX family transcriptional regulator [Chloroflexota bacterium]MCC6893918.1 RecX family transcriptional regulator [Anaerolineae bacterium]
MGNGVITALEIQKRDKERVNVFIDGEFAFGLNLLDAARLRKGQVLAEAEIATLRNDDAIVQAVNTAAHFLSYRPRSEQEIRRNLKDKDVPEDVIEVAVQRLQGLGYLDDAAFARYWVDNRNQFKPLSHRALRQELRQKGVSDALISETLGDQSESDLAYQAATTQLRKLRNRTEREFKTKISTFLQRRGFGYSTTQDVVARLIDTLESDDPDYFNRENDLHED